MKDLDVTICTDNEKCDVGHEPRWRPDSCWSWLVCAGAVISFVVVSGISYSFGLLLPPFMEHFEATRQETGNKITIQRNQSGEGWGFYLTCAIWVKKIVKE